MTTKFKTVKRDKSGYIREYKDGSRATFTKSGNGGRAKLSGGSHGRTNKRKK